MASRKNAISDNTEHVTAANELLTSLITAYVAARDAAFDAFEALTEARYNALQQMQSDYHSWDPTADPRKIAYDEEFIKPIRIPVYYADYFHSYETDEFLSKVHENQAGIFNLTGIDPDQV